MSPSDFSKLLVYVYITLFDRKTADFDISAQKMTSYQLLVSAPQTGLLCCVGLFKKCKNVTPVSDYCAGTIS